MAYTFVKVPALVTLPDASQLGLNAFEPAKVVLHEGSDVLQVVTQEGKQSPPTVVFQSRLTAPYSGTFSAAAAVFQTSDGQVSVVDGPGCGCGFAIKTFLPEPPVLDLDG